MIKNKKKYIFINYNMFVYKLSKFEININQIITNN